MTKQERFESFLKEVSPYVIVVGSFARHEETTESDIDCYIKNRPEQERAENYDLEESYMPEIIAITNKYGYDFSSCIIGHIAIEFFVPRMIEFSSLFKIPRTTTITKRHIYGVEFDCAIDDKDADYEDCIGYYN